MDQLSENFTMFGNGQWAFKNRNLYRLNDINVLTRIMEKLLARDQIKDIVLDQDYSIGYCRKFCN